MSLAFQTAPYVGVCFYRHTDSSHPGMWRDSSCLCTRLLTLEAALDGKAAHVQCCAERRTMVNEHCFCTRATWNSICLKHRHWAPEWALSDLFFHGQMCPRRALSRCISNSNAVNQSLGSGAGGRCSKDRVVFSTLCGLTLMGASELNATSLCFWEHLHYVYDS